jgi:hypothetical protein
MGQSATNRLRAPDGPGNLWAGPAPGVAVSVTGDLAGLVVAFGGLAGGCWGMGGSPTGCPAAGDDRAPLIVANSSRVSPAARSFTLVHELAHLYLRQDAACIERTISGKPCMVLAM